MAYFPFLNPKYYNDSPTLVELVNKLAAEMIDVQRNLITVDEVVQEIHTWINSTGQTIGEEVRAKINDMYESGELADIINALVTENIQPRIDEVVETITESFETLEESIGNTVNELVNNTQDLVEETITNLEETAAAILDTAQNIPKSNIDFARVGRKVYNTIENSALDNRLTGGTESAANAFTYVQGACKAVKNNQTFYILCLLNNNKYSDGVLNNSCKVVILNESGTEIHSRIFADMGHANSVTYDPVNDDIYIVQNSYSTSASERTYTNKIYRVLWDLTSYNAKNANIDGLSVLNSCEWHDGTLYVGNNLKIATYDYANNTGEIVLDLPMPSDVVSGVNQEMAVNDKFFFFLISNPNRIIRVNRATNKIDWLYDIPYNINNGWLPVGEVESISVDDDGLCYLFSAMHLVEQRVFNAYDMAQIFKQNLYTNNIIAPNMAHADNTVIAYGSDEMVFTVDKSSTEFNPTGSKLHPFYCVQEAIAICCSCSHSFRWQIRLIHGNEDSLIFIPQGDIFLRGPQSTAEDSAYSGTTPVRRIGSVVVYGGNVRLDHLIIKEGTYQYMHEYADRAKYSAYIRNATIALSEIGLQRGVNSANVGAYRVIGCPAFVIGGDGSTSEDAWETLGGSEFVTRNYSICNVFGDYI